MCDCEVLKASPPDGTSKTSEWLLKSGNFTTNGCIHKASSSDESSRSSSPVKSSEVKLGGNDSTITREIPRRHRKHRHAKSHKKHEASTDRFRRTATVLRCSGLLQITTSISQLLHENEKLQTEIDKLKYETKEHSVQLQRQLQKNLEAERESNGTCSQEGQKLLTKLSQFKWNWRTELTQSLFACTVRNFCFHGKKSRWARHMLYILTVCHGHKYYVTTFRQ